jgi:hypothetical protein
VTTTITADVQLDAEEVSRSLRLLDSKTARAWTQTLILSLDSDLYRHVIQTITENPVSYTECPRCHRWTDPVVRGNGGQKCAPRCEYCKAVLP